MLADEIVLSSISLISTFPYLTIAKNQDVAALLTLQSAKLHK